jgi:hypothetical protein
MKHPTLLSFVVMSALAAPAATALANVTPAVAQTEKHSERAEPRVYDREHRQYHVWNDVEDRAYRAWLATKHFTYRQYSRLRAAERRAYWRWRHDHRDADDRR